MLPAMRWYDGDLCPEYWFGLKRVPVVALCQRVSVPVVVGILKPMTLLPPALLCGLDPNQLAAILSHELAHIRRYDLIVNLLQRIVEALLFFHPVTW
jgi:beta-lactamase regulating signal transducer with metallopeptidase domain